MYLLGIDVGTGGTRALIVDEKGIVRKVFVGKLDESHSEEVLRILRTGAL